MTDTSQSPKPHAACNAKHTAFQPTDEQWKCPKCGSDNERFNIEEGVEAAHDSCNALHAGDFCYCHECGNGWSGAALSKTMMKAFNLVVCECCKGAGVVQKKI